MAIISVIGGTVLVKMKVDFRATDINDIQTNLPNATYNGKTFLLADGTYVYVDSNGEIGTPGANELDPSKSAVDGPVSVTSNRYIVSQFTNNNNHDIDPKGDGNADGIDFLVVSSNANGRRWTGLVKPLNSKGKTLFIYNDSNNSISLRNLDSNSSAENRFDLDGNKTLAGKAGMILWYDDISNRWKKI